MDQKTTSEIDMRQPLRLHFSEITSGEADIAMTATRYFPNVDVSRATAGVNHCAPLCKELSTLGWVETDRRQPYMFQGRKTSAIEYERGRSFLLLTVYREDNAVWTFVKIRGYGSDVLELRDWMQTYETNYGRLRG